MKVLFINKTIPVLVDHVESLLELLNLRLVKHGKHIRGCTLRSLLGVFALGPFAGHDEGRWVTLSYDIDT